MSWEPDTATVHPTMHEAVSAVAMTIALAAPLLLVARFVFQIV
jgi:hypothetical protein